MSENKISYLDRTFDDYKESLKKYVTRYYPQIASDFNDASIGSWLIDIVAAVGDNLSQYIDKAYNETNIDTAKSPAAVYALARSNGLKVPGPKASMAEVIFSCELPVQTGSGGNSPSGQGMPDYNFAPVIKKGTKVASKNQVFEVMNDIDFSSQVDYNMVSNRTIIPLYDSNENISSYRITKREVVCGGESKIYKQVINGSDLVPFMEVILPDANVMEVESVIFKDGSNFKSDPTIGEFMIENEHIVKNGKEIMRFFEVNSLAEQYRWADDVSRDNNQITAQGEKVEYGYYNALNQGVVPVVSVVKGKWRPITQKFITEFTDKGYLKIIFGSGEQSGQEEFKYDNASTFSQYQISRMIRNNFLGKLPKAGWTMYVLYRVGGGAVSNVAANSITNITYLNAEIGKASDLCTDDGTKNIADVKNSIKVTNPTPSISGKDAPTVDEIKAMIKYNNGAQERCVTLKDYENRIAFLPPRYGCPFRVSAIEENNKVLLYMLGLDNNGRLSNVFPEQLIANILNYLSMYRSINDLVEIKGGEIIHLSFEADLIVDKNYVSGDVSINVINTIKNYMDINKHYLGEDIFVGDLEKEINNVDGVLNLIELRVYHMRDIYAGRSYSNSQISQALYKDTVSPDCWDEDFTNEEGRQRIDLRETNYVLNSDVDSMFEIKYPQSDIIVRMITR